MTGDFNIRNNDWNLSYPYHSLHTDTVYEVADSFGLEMSTPINLVSIQYINNAQDSNLVLDLMFLYIGSEKLDKHEILLDP